MKRKLRLSRQRFSPHLIFSVLLSVVYGVIA